MLFDYIDDRSPMRYIKISFTYMTFPRDNIFHNIFVQHRLGLSSPMTEPVRVKVMLK